jgi:hypothetical protein
VLASEYADRGVLLAGLEALRGEIAELKAGLGEPAAIEPELPHRACALRLNRRLAERILHAHLEWLDEVGRDL